MGIIVLGATGYLGSRAVKELVRQNQHVLCLKREQSSLGNLREVLGKVQVCGLREFGDFLDNNRGKYHSYLNFSCRYPSCGYSDIDIYESNMMAPLRVFLECLGHGVRRHITIGTGLADEFNVYTVSKRKYAELCKWHAEYFQNVERDIVQICNVELESFYGEGEPDSRFIPGLIQKLKKNEDIQLTLGNQKRDFIYAGDVVRIVAELAQRTDLPQYLDLPVGTGEGVTVRALAEYLKEITGSVSKLCFGAVEKRMNEQDSFADCTKMKELGLYTNYSWRDGLKKIV